MIVLANMKDGETKTSETSDAISRWVISARVDAILIKLLDAIERRVAEGGLCPLEAYDMLCRAERLRSGL